MSPAEWATLIAAVVSTVAIFVAGIKWVVRHYLTELKPNGGGSLRDSVNRLEERVDKIFELLSQQK